MFFFVRSYFPQLRRLRVPPERTKTRNILHRDSRGRNWRSGPSLVPPRWVQRESTQKFWDWINPFESTGQSTAANSVIRGPKQKAIDYMMGSGKGKWWPDLPSSEEDINRHREIYAGNAAAMTKSFLEVGREVVGAAPLRIGGSSGPKNAFSVGTSWAGAGSSPVGTSWAREGWFSWHHDDHVGTTTRKARRALRRNSMRPSSFWTDMSSSFSSRGGTRGGPVGLVDVGGEDHHHHLESGDSTSSRMAPSRFPTALPRNLCRRNLYKTKQTLLHRPTSFSHDHDGGPYRQNRAPLQQTRAPSHRTSFRFGKPNRSPLNNPAHPAYVDVINMLCLGTELVVVDGELEETERVLSGRLPTREKCAGDIASPSSVPMNRSTQHDYIIPTPWLCAHDHSAFPSSPVELGVGAGAHRPPRWCRPSVREGRPPPGQPREGIY